MIIYNAILSLIPQFLNHIFQFYDKVPQSLDFVNCLGKPKKNDSLWNGI